MKKLFVVFVVVFIASAYLGQCQKPDSKPAVLKMSPQFGRERNLIIPGLSIIDSNESTSVRLGDKEIYFYKWQLGYQNSHKVSGRLVVIESGEDYFLLAGGEIWINKVFHIKNGQIVAQFNFDIVEIDKVEEVYISNKRYLKISYANNTPRSGGQAPHESILLLWN